MKKNKLIYIILSLIILFGYKENVYADLKTEAASKPCDELIEDGTIDTKSETFLFDGSDYDVNCLYTMTYTTSLLSVFDKHVGFVKNSCTILQLAFDNNGEYAIEGYGRLGNPNYFSAEEKKFLKIFSRDEAKKLDKDYLAKQNGVCPISVRYDDYAHMDDFYIGSYKPNMKRVHRTDIHVTIPPLVSELNEEIGESSCQNILGEKGVGILKTIKTLLQVAVPILLLVLGSLDFGTAIFAGDENEMKKSQQKFVKRVIFSVVIFLIPPILGVVLDMAHQIWPVIDASLCGIYD